MKNPKLLLMVTVAFIAVSGLTQGLVQRRWSSTDQLPIAARRLQMVPEKFGHWSSEELTLSDTEISTGRIHSYVRREYRNAQTGSAVGVLLMVGEAGPISLHPPTVCLKGQGFRMLRDASTSGFPMANGSSEPSSFRMFRADFQSSQSSDELLTRLYWAWSTDGIWEAADNPRFQFAGQPLLYKLYVTERWRPTETRTDAAVAERFLKEFLPEVRRSIAAEVSDVGHEAVSEETN